MNLRVEQYNSTHKGNICFILRDTGIGIPKEKIEHIFCEFIQVDSSITRKFGGTGLGLAIVKKLVTMMGGEIWIESELNKGTTFYFTVNLLVNPPIKENGRSIENLNGSLTSTRVKRPASILLVEDTIDNQLLVKAFFKNEPYSIAIAENGVEAVCMFKEKKYDLVLMDVQMPVMDGYTATKSIRDWEMQMGYEATPIIALTAFALEEDVKRSIEAGCNAHLIKPINKITLLTSVEKWLM